MNKILYNLEKAKLYFLYKNKRNIILIPYHHIIQDIYVQHFFNIIYFIRLF